MRKWSKAFQSKVNRINRSLKALEGAGLQTASPSYKSISSKAVGNLSPLFKLSEIPDGDTQIRLKTWKDFQKMDAKTRKSYKEAVEKISGHQTLTPGGYRKWQDKKFKEFKDQLVTATSHEVMKKDGSGPKLGRGGKPIMVSPYKNLTKQQFAELMRATENLETDRGQHYSSEQINEVLDHLDLVESIDRDIDLEDLFKAYFSDTLQDMLGRELLSILLI